MLTPVEEVSAGTGILLKGNPGTYEMPFILTTASYNNLLKGTLVEQALPTIEGEYTNYIFANGSNGLGFYKSSGNGNIAANKAYLQLPTSLSQSRNMIRIDGDATCIELPRQDTSQPDVIYNLSGQRIERPQYGVYIIGGKKLFIHKK